jgi:hypothetical protein
MRSIMGGDLNLLQTDWKGDAEKAILGDEL